MTELVCMLRLQGFVIFWVQVGPSIPYVCKLKKGASVGFYIWKDAFFIRWVAKTNYWWEMEVVLDFGKIGFWAYLLEPCFGTQRCIWEACLKHERWKVGISVPECSCQKPSLDLWDSWMEFGLEESFLVQCQTSQWVMHVSPSVDFWTTCSSKT